MQNSGSPVSFRLPIPSERDMPVAEQRVTTCPADGVPRVLPVLCRYSSGLNVTVPAACDGRSQVVNYRCPTMPRCVFWNTTSRSFGSSGCQTSGLSSSGQVMQSSCTHLTTFSSIADNVISATLSSKGMGWSSDGTMRQTSAGLLILMGAIYGSLLVALVCTRMRRANQGWAFLA